MESNKENLALLFRRRSIRNFESGPISEAIIQSLLEAAMAAPSAAAKDPWRFIVVRETATLNKIADVLPSGQMLRTASVGIVVCGDLSAAHDQLLSYMLQDCSAAIENITLAGVAMGLGTCWLGVHPREDRIKALSQLFHLPASIIPVSVVAIGKPAEHKEPRTRYQKAFVHYENW